MKTLLLILALALGAAEVALQELRKKGGRKHCFRARSQRFEGVFGRRYHLY